MASLQALHLDEVLNILDDASNAGDDIDIDQVEERAGGLGPGGNLSQRPGWKKQGRKVKQGQGCKAPTWPGVETTAGRDPEEEDVPTKTRKLS